jgi:hypothetical protein
MADCPQSGKVGQGSETNAFHESLCEGKIAIRHENNFGRTVSVTYRYLHILPTFFAET